MQEKAILVAQLVSMQGTVEERREELLSGRPYPTSEQEKAALVEFNALSQVRYNKLVTTAHSEPESAVAVSIAAMHLGKLAGVPADLVEPVQALNLPGSCIEHLGSVLEHEQVDAPKQTVVKKHRTENRSRQRLSRQCAD